MGDLSLHFSRHEFDLPADKAARHGCEPAPYPEDWIDSRLMPLVKALEVLRAELGGARITVISGYRPLEYNRKLGSKDDSQHVQGRAADIQVEGFSPLQVHAAVMKLYDRGDLEIGGVGLYDDFLHLDVRGGPLRRWDERTRK